MQAVEKNWWLLFAILMGTGLQGVMAIVWTSMYGLFVFNGIMWKIASPTQKITSLVVWFSVELVLALAISIGCALIARSRRRVFLVILLVGQAVALSWGIWGSGSLRF